MCWKYHRMIIQPRRGTGLLALLAGWAPLDDTFPDVSETLLPLPPVTLCPTPCSTPTSSPT